MSVVIRCEVEDIRDFLRDRDSTSERLGMAQADASRVPKLEHDLAVIREELRTAMRPNTTVVSASVRQIQELIKAQKNGEKIGMIKVVREMTGLGLKEAKDLVEGVMGSIMARPTG